MFSIRLGTGVISSLFSNKKAASTSLFYYIFIKFSSLVWNVLFGVSFCIFVFCSFRYTASYTWRMYTVGSTLVVDLAYEKKLYICNLGRIFHRNLYNLSSYRGNRLIFIMEMLFPTPWRGKWCTLSITFISHQHQGESDAVWLWRWSLKWIRIMGISSSFIII